MQMFCPPNALVLTPAFLSSGCSVCTSIVTGNGRQIRILIFARMHAHILAGHVTRSASQETRYSSSGFARKNSRQKTPPHRIAYLYEAYMDNLGSQPSLFRHLRAAVGECVCPSSFCPTRFQNVWFSLELVQLLAVSVSHEM